MSDPRVLLHRRRRRAIKRLSLTRRTEYLIRRRDMRVLKPRLLAAHLHPS